MEFTAVPNVRAGHGGTVRTVASSPTWAPPRSLRRSQLVLALLGSVAILAYNVLPTVAADVVFQVTAWACLATFVVGLRRRNLPLAGPWLLFLAGFALFALGDLLYTICQDVLGLSPFPSAADVAYLAGYPVLMTSLALFIRSRERRSDRGALIDACIIGVALGVIAWVCLVVPMAGAAGQGVLARAISMAYPVGDIMCLTLLVRLLIGGRAGAHRTPPALWIMTATMAAVLLGDFGFALAESAGLAVSSGWTDALFMASYIGVAAVGLEASAPMATRPIVAGRRELSPRRLLVLAAAALLIPTLLAFEGVRGQQVAIPVFAIGTFLTIVLVAMRVSGLIKDLQASRDELAHRATHDPLTGIANRSLFSAGLTDAVTAGRRCAVLLIDLDRFKDINDRHGHLTGDALLVEVAQRLISVVRAGDLVARLAGDEFAVLLPGADTSVASVVAARAVEALNAEVEVSGVTMRLGASIGMAVWSGSAAEHERRPALDEADRLLAEADQAMYEAKRGPPAISWPFHSSTPTWRVPDNGGSSRRWPGAVPEGRGGESRVSAQPLTLRGSVTPTRTRELVAQQCRY